eukprot:8437175-Alexandrium_andersonii.AAC.1
MAHDAPGAGGQRDPKAAPAQEYNVPCAYAELSGRPGEHRAHGLVAVATDPQWGSGKRRPQGNRRCHDAPGRRASKGDRVLDVRGRVHVGGRATKK